MRRSKDPRRYKLSLPTINETKYDKASKVKETFFHRLRRNKKAVFYGCCFSPGLLIYICAKSVQYARKKIVIMTSDDPQEMVDNSAEVEDFFSFGSDIEVPSIDLSFFGRFFSDTVSIEVEPETSRDEENEEKGAETEEQKKEESKIEIPNLDDLLKTIEDFELELKDNTLLEVEEETEIMMEKPSSIESEEEVETEYQKDRVEGDSLTVDDLPLFPSINDVIDSQKEKEEEPRIEQKEEKKIEASNLADGSYFDGHTMVLLPQIELPTSVKPMFQNVNNERNFWPFQNYLKKQGWVKASDSIHPSRVSMFFTKGKVPSFFLKKYKQDPNNWKRYSNKLLNSIGVSGCIGGQKSLQLKCRQALSASHGCKYENLKIQPEQYVIKNKADCDSFFDIHLKNNKQWLYKPSNTFHGSGIKLYSSTHSLLTKFKGCPKSKSAYNNKYNDGVIMEYISNPATIKGGYKFDFRTYLLVASTNPKLVFYHDGFARKADTKMGESSRNSYITNSVSQSENDHFFNFSRMDSLLEEELGKSFRNFFEEKREYLKQATRFMFETTSVQKNKIQSKNGRFHLFGVDWIVDKEKQIHLLEGNGFPLVTNYKNIGLTPKIWNDMGELILKIHTEPHLLGEEVLVEKDFSLGGWKLVYNELESDVKRRKGKDYNVCDIFPLQ